jgi:GMP synthase-like glutamine amidotransferase
MKILILDNNIDRDAWGAADLREYAKKITGATVYVRRPPHGDLPKDPKIFDRIIVSGSKTSVLEDAPWIEALLEFIRRAVNENKPFLGVCYGHQSLIRSLGGIDGVGKSTEPEFGWTQVELVNESPLFKGLPRKFYTYSSHFEEVKKLPNGILRLAQSKDCEIQACQLEKKPIFGIQFHPEKSLVEAEKSLAARKKMGIPKKLLFPNQGKKYYDPKVAEVIFENFFSI